MKTTIQKKEGKVDEVTGYVVPDNYFEQLSEEIGMKTYSGTKSNIRSIHKRTYLVAASIAILIGASIILYVAADKTVTTESNALYATNYDSASNTVSIIAPEVNAKEPELMEANAKEENIDNAIIEAAEELNLSDEELVEFAELLEI
jgi:DNA-binding beta-propeller fold protein YncE